MRKFPFHVTWGPNPLIYGSEPFTALSIFESFQTDEIIDKICRETNRHGFRKQVNSTGNCGRYNNWERIVPSQIRLVDAILTTMGIVHLPHLSHYWSKDPFYDYTFVKKIMPRDDFLRIFSSLHFNNDDEEPELPHDKLYKLRDIVNKYKYLFKTNYIPKQNISVDEALDLWKSKRVAFSVHIPRKKAKNGIQQYRICEADTGYCMDFEYYSGSKEEPYDNVQIDGADVSEFTTPAKIVLHLIKPYLNKGYCVGLDNLYTDPRLFKLLLENGTDAIGTFRSNRKCLPEEVRAKSLKRLQRKGDTRVWFKKVTQTKGIMTLLWQDKKLVRIMSTFHDDEMEEVPDKCRQHIDPNATRMKPEAIVDYKSVMSGVDKMDQMMASYDPTRKRYVYLYIYI